LTGDKGYCADWIDEYFMELGSKPVIPSKSNEDGDTRSGDFDGEGNRDRNVVGRLIGGLKTCRRLFSRFEKTAKNFAGRIRMAFIQRYLKPICP